MCKNRGLNRAEFWVVFHSFCPKMGEMKIPSDSRFFSQVYNYTIFGGRNDWRYLKTVFLNLELSK